MKSVGTSRLALISTENKLKKIRIKVVGLEGHPLYHMLPEVKITRYQLRRKSALKLKVNKSWRFMNSFVNGLTLHIIPLRSLTSLLLLLFHVL